MTIFPTKYDGSLFNIDGRFGEQYFDKLLPWCHNKMASDINIQTNEKIKIDIAGCIFPITKKLISQPEIDNIVSYFYGTNGPSELLSGHDLDLSYEIKNDKHETLRFRINATSGRIDGGQGVQITIRILPKSPPRLDDLSIEKEILENKRPSNGMVLVTGPTGSGKSTLLSSIISSVLEERENEKILEFSSPIEYIYDSNKKSASNSIFQTEIPRHLHPRYNTKNTDDESLYANAIRNALRRKPTIIMIGEARDRATIKASIEASQTGHLLYTTMHTIGVAETLRRASLCFENRERETATLDLIESLRVIVSQILLPRVGGGKIACREYLIFTRKIREELLASDPKKWTSTIRQLFKNGSGRTMSRSAENLLNKGIISNTTFEHVAMKKI